jgi:hypothetical protein
LYSLAVPSGKVIFIILFATFYWSAKVINIFNFGLLNSTAMVAESFIIVYFYNSWYIIWKHTLKLLIFPK